MSLLELLKGCASIWIRISLEAGGDMDRNEDGDYDLWEILEVKKLSFALE